MMRSILLTLVGVCLNTVPALCNEIVVGACANSASTTIQGGIDRAAPGDTVTVCSGVYSGGLLVNKSRLTLRAGGPKGTVKIAGHGSGPHFGITVVESNVTVDGFEITGFGGSFDASGILVGGRFVGDTVGHAGGARIINNVIHDNLNGIYLWQSGDNSVQHNEVYNSLDLDGGEGNAIVSNCGLSDAQVTAANNAGRCGRDNDISLNTLHDNDRMAIFVGATSASVSADVRGTAAQQNEVYRNGADEALGGAFASSAITVELASGASIQDNNMHENPIDGLLVALASGITVADNKANSNGEVRVLVLLAQNVNVHDNQVNRNSLYGMVIISSTGGTVRANSASKNGALDLLWDGTGILTFSHNTAASALPSKAAWNGI